MPVRNFPSAFNYTVPKHYGEGDGRRAPAGTIFRVQLIQRAHKTPEGFGDTWIVMGPDQDGKHTDVGKLYAVRDAEEMDDPDGMTAMQHPLWDHDFFRQVKCPLSVGMAEDIVDIIHRRYEQWLSRAAAQPMAVESFIRLFAHV